ncbi:N-acetyltransferase family 8 member 3 [Fukomys damarensis]|uniref:Putative N-acetyltransferase 8B n=1 Tax=Fukomys damarensis TaxID=885580 RepID=A0A091DE54_FUKDA|nr:N-acetyltransferase family 8 member 3 [Fukomys damarensis]XP_010607887.1 N-acetyltransferase family 8 member 3 [Fukomys damarensis]XP_010607889.1 N-acetyltransferase family 8 member 3 [Fukomys damarensis]XP_010607891.1 N-acetyltransferase family 8 member 3 [Fukomys damarensis]XP_010607893.1 N-acetyltransferase family 8 member 3 [Fukomys damarensis]XP_033620693.1 N-acetyltransferase family 8 member 3 [Fukomys damarensis]KFO21081.1 Putative N-acetyltransferase 8B [Fukomys damarensis]
MAPYHIRKYQESDRKPVLDLFSNGLLEHIPITFYKMLILPQTLLFILGVLFSILLVSGSWFLVIVSSFILLAFLWLLARYTWKNRVDLSLRTDMADITKSYLRACGSCFWVAESGGQVVGIVCALPEENPALEKKQLRLRHLSVAMEHRGEGIGKALVRTVLQFAREQGCSEVVLTSSVLQYAALGLYQGMGFQKTRHSFYSWLSRLRGTPLFHFTYCFPSAQEGAL